MQRTVYPTDLTDTQWSLIEPLMPEQKQLGRSREVDLREVVNAAFYINRAGCQWDMLPHHLPNFKTVNWYYNESRHSGLWEVIMNALRVRCAKLPTATKPQLWLASTAVMNVSPW